MPFEQIDEYQIEYSGVPLPFDIQWAAHLAIYGTSPNPMHRNCLFPRQRVSVTKVFFDATQAEAEARKVALAMFKPTTKRGDS